MIDYQTFLKRLGETQMPFHGTLYRVLDDFCEEWAYFRQDGSGLPAVEQMLDGLGKKIWAGLTEVVEIERRAARAEAMAEKRKGPRGEPKSP